MAKNNKNIKRYEEEIKTTLFFTEFKKWLVEKYADINSYYNIFEMEEAIGKKEFKKAEKEFRATIPEKDNKEYFKIVKMKETPCLKCGDLIKQINQGGLVYCLDCSTIKEQEYIKLIQDALTIFTQQNTLFQKVGYSNMGQQNYFLNFTESNRHNSGKHQKVINFIIRNELYKEEKIIPIYEFGIEEQDKQTIENFPHSKAFLEEMKKQNSFYIDIPKETNIKISREEIDKLTGEEQKQYIQEQVELQILKHIENRIDYIRYRS